MVGVRRGRDSSSEVKEGLGSPPKVREESGGPRKSGKGRVGTPEVQVGL